MTMTASESAMVQRYVLRLGNQSLTLPIQVNANEQEQEEVVMQIQSNKGKGSKEKKTNGLTGIVEPILTCGKREDALTFLSVDEEYIFVVGGKVNKECEDKVAALQSQIAQQEQEEEEESNKLNNYKKIKENDKLCNTKENNHSNEVNCKDKCTEETNNEIQRKRREEEMIMNKKKKKQKVKNANSLVKAIPETWLSHFPLVECYDITNKTWFAANGNSCNNNEQVKSFRSYLQLKWPVRSGIAILPHLQETSKDEINSDKNYTDSNNAILSHENHVKLLVPVQVAFIGGWSSYKASRLSSMIMYPNILNQEENTTHSSSRYTKQEWMDRSNAQLLAQLPRVITLNSTLSALCYHTCSFIRHSFYIFGGEMMNNYTNVNSINSSEKQEEMENSSCSSSTCACSNILYQITHPQLQRMYAEMMNASINKSRCNEEHKIIQDCVNNEKQEVSMASNEFIKKEDGLNEESKKGGEEVKEEGWVCMEITPLPFHMNREISNCASASASSVHDTIAMSHRAIRTNERLMPQTNHKSVETTKVRSPAPRASHCACVLQQRFLLIFGGRRIRRPHHYRICNNSNNKNNKSNSGKGDHLENSKLKDNEEEEEDEWDREEEEMNAQVASLEEEREAQMELEYEQQQESSSKLRKNSASHKRKESNNRLAHSSRSGKDTDNNNNGDNSNNKKRSASEMKSTMGKSSTKKLENAKVGKAGMNRSGKGTKSDKTSSKYDTRGKKHYNDGEYEEEEQQDDDDEEYYMNNDNNGVEGNISAQRNALPHFALYNDIAIFDTFTHQWLQVIVNANGESEIPTKRYGAAMNVIPLCSLSAQNSPKRVMPHVSNNNKVNSVSDCLSIQTKHKLCNPSFFTNQLQNLLDKAPNHFFTSPSASTCSVSCYSPVNSTNHTVNEQNTIIINRPITNYIKNDVIWGAEVVMHGGIDSHGRVLNDAWVLQVLNQPLHTSKGVNSTKTVSLVKPTSSHTLLQEQELNKELEEMEFKEDNKQEMNLDPPSVTVQWIRLTALNSTVTNQSSSKIDNDSKNKINLNETKQNNVNYNNNNKNSSRSTCDGQENVVGVPVNNKEIEEEEEEMRNCLPARAHHSLVVTTQREVYLIGGVSSLTGAQKTSSLVNNTFAEKNNKKNNNNNNSTKMTRDSIKELCHFTIAPRARIVKNVRRSSSARYSVDKNMNNNNNDSEENKRNIDSNGSSSGSKRKGSVARRNESSSEKPTKESKQDV